MTSASYEFGYELVMFKFSKLQVERVKIAWGQAMVTGTLEQLSRDHR